MKHIDQIKTLLAQGEIEKSFDTFIELIELNSSDSDTAAIYDEIILLSGRYKSIEKEIRLGIISLENEKIEKNRIRHDLLKIVNDFSEKIREGTILKVEKNTPEPKLIQKKNIKTRRILIEKEENLKPLQSGARDSTSVQKKAFYNSPLQGCFFSAVVSVLITYMINHFIVDKFIFDFNEAKPISILLAVVFVFCIVSIGISKIIEHYKLF